LPDDAPKPQLPRAAEGRLKPKRWTFPIGSGWIREIKLDRYRLMARRDPVGIRLLTRNGRDWAPRFPLIVEAVNHIKVRSASSAVRPWPATTMAWPSSIGCARSPKGRTSTSPEVGASRAAETLRVPAA
jgi:hypothetical protein